VRWSVRTVDQDFDGFGGSRHLVTPKTLLESVRVKVPVRCQEVLDSYYARQPFELSVEERCTFFGGNKCVLNGPGVGL
jgi:hypothetical protein